ncbi:MAG: crotonase/enoyl-CoA hydratase family protein [Acidimicrobiia bacterium]
MEFTEIDYSLDDGIATITLDRPAQLNAYTQQMRREILAAFDRTDADDDVRAVVLTGRGRAFCAGADLSSGGSRFATGAPDVEQAADGTPRDGGGMSSMRIFASLKPVIAAINGPAVGVGITMTLPADIRLMSSNAKLGFPFTRRGIVPEAASSWFLPRLVGLSTAAEWLYSGRFVMADEALATGLVRSVHEPDDLLPAAYALAHQLTDDSAPVSIALTRQLLLRGMIADHPMTMHRADSRGVIQRGRSADAQEGIASFLEKRPANFPLKVSDGLPELFPDWEEPGFA